MLQEIINKLKNRKHELQNITSPSQPKKEDLKILLSQNDIFFKLEINDYISIVDYFEQMKLIDFCGVESLISNSILWNSREQKVNKGTYYVVTVDNRLYNILVNENEINIDERIQGDRITEERIIRLENNVYWCSLFHHDETGDTIYVRYFNTKGFSMGKLDLTKEEAIEEFKPVIDNLKNIVGMEEIIDIKTLEMKSYK